MSFKNGERVFMYTGQNDDDGYPVTMSGDVVKVTSRSVTVRWGDGRQETIDRSVAKRVLHRAFGQNRAGLSAAAKRSPMLGSATANWAKAKKIDMVVAMYGDFALYGASAHPAADTRRYWMQLSLDDEPFALFYAKVPPELVDALEKHGTSEQIYSDGYEGWAAVAPYIKPKKPFYVSHEYDEHAGAWERGSDEDENMAVGEATPTYAVGERVYLVDPGESRYKPGYAIVVGANERGGVWLQTQPQRYSVPGEVAYAVGKTHGGGALWFTAGALRKVRARGTREPAPFPYFVNFTQGYNPPRRYSVPVPSWEVAESWKRRYESFGDRRRITISQKAPSEATVLRPNTEMA